MHVRKLVLFAASAVVLCGALWQLANKPTDANNAIHAEPGLIADRLGDLNGLQRVPLASQGTVDPNVRPTVATLPISAAVAMQLAGNQDTAFAISNVSQGDYAWPRSASTVLLLSEVKEIKIYGVNATSDQMTFAIGEQPVDPAPTVDYDESTGEWSATLALADSVLFQQIKVTHASKFDTIPVRLPGADPGQKPQITAASNNIYIQPADTLDLNVYNRFLRLKGQFVQTGTPLIFQVFRKKGSGNSASEFNEFQGFATDPANIADNGICARRLGAPF